MSDELDFDVTILGGGLAGLCLARQLVRTRAGIRVLVLESRCFPVREAAHKVGESTVELGAHYLEHVLGLEQHLRADQLPKLGLRFFFDAHGAPFGSGLELGLTKPYPTPSYQLDRGRLENFLAAELMDAGVVLRSGARVGRRVDLDAQGGHLVHYHEEGRERSVRTRWVVDALGRRSILPRQLGLGEEIAHRIHSAWFRIDARLRVDDWRDWGGTGGREEVPLQRWLGTNHLMGAGYWVWLIPLASGATSVGIVADPRLHPLSDFNSFERAMAWLGRHEPECAARILATGRPPLDFLAVKNMTRSVSQVFSADRWALTGEAGVFLDPFYSPGTDFIAVANTMICALVERDLRRRPIGALTKMLDEFYLELFHNSMRVYEKQYALFGNAKVMTAKILWDYAVYWSFPAFLFIQGRITHVSDLTRIRPGAHMIGELNARMQAFFREWHHASDEPVPETFVDQSRIECLARLNAGLTEQLPGEAFHARFEEKLARLQSLAVELVEHAAGEHPSLLVFRGEAPVAAGDEFGPLWGDLAPLR